LCLSLLRHKVSLAGDREIDPSEQELPVGCRLHRPALAAESLAEAAGLRAAFGTGCVARGRARARSTSPPTSYRLSAYTPR